MTDRPIAYCGLPPTPSELMGAWNLDPVLLAGLAVLGWVIQRHARRPGLAWAGWGLAVLIFVSPLCNLTSALFSVRVFHHVALSAAVAPLLVAGFGIGGRWARHGMMAALFHAIAMWLFHAPAAYDWALSSVAGYWLMQAAIGLSAIWLWAAILNGPRGAGFAAAGVSFVQMGMLGAIILFAGAPLYAAHFLTTEPWGLSALGDQQIAGLVMWVPAAGPYMAAMLLAVRDLLEDRPEVRGA